MKNSKCKFCNSRCCHYRIVSQDKTYDEVACDKHIRDLEGDADNVLDGKIRNHISSSAIVSRAIPKSLPSPLGTKRE